MSFTMENIKRKMPNKQDIVKDCYKQLFMDDLLTENIKLGIWKYCNYRFKSRNTGKFNYNILQTMIIELLENCCHKSYLKITKQDVEREEYSIIYHIKRAIYFGSTKTIYYEQADEINLNKLNTGKVDFTINCTGARLTTDDVNNYFKDLMI